MPLISTCSKDMMGGGGVYRWGMGAGTSIRLSREHDGLGRKRRGEREGEHGGGNEETGGGQSDGGEEARGRGGVKQGRARWKTSGEKIKHNS